MKIAINLWKILNSPLIVVLVALLSWPLFSAFTMHYAVERITTDTIESVTDAFASLGSNNEEALEIAAIKKHIIIKNINTAHTSWKNKEKFLATIVNNHKNPIREIMLNISFYDADDNLIDVVNNYWATGSALLEVGGIYNFSYEREIGSMHEEESILNSRRSKRIEVAVSSVKAIDE